MTKENIIDNIARLNSETWRDREEVRTEIGKLLSELKKALEQPTSDDCVSRQAVDELCFRYLKANTDDNIAFYEHFRDLPPVTPTQRWIPVSERLPRQGVEVLTCNECGFIEIQSLEDGYWENQHGDCTDLEDSDIIAWQPLPKAYEEK